MALPNREKRSGFQDEVLAGQYVLRALPDDVMANLAKRVKKDRQFAATVRRWQDNIADTDRRERRLAREVGHALKRPQGAGQRDQPGRPSLGAVLVAVWKSVRFWRLMTLAALIWAAVLMATGH